MSKKQRYSQALIGFNLRKKYQSSYIKNQTTCSLVSQHLINSIVKPKHYVNSFRINFEDTQIICNTKQYLKRYYSNYEYWHKLSALAQYYKYHKNYPCNLDAGIQVIRMIYQQSKNKQQRKFLKKLMNQAPSVSDQIDNSSIGSQNQQNTKQKIVKDSFSLKLRQLDSNRSSVMLGDICQQIKNALMNVKPLYFYKGNYNDGVKQFKNFMLNRHKPIFETKKPFVKRKLVRTSQRVNILQIQPVKNQKNHLNKQNQCKINKNQSLLKIKLELSKHFRKTFHINPSQNIKQIQKKKSISRLKRNKTLTIKPQSFSKTTANETVSKEQYYQQQPVNKKINNVRFRKCKSSRKNLTLNITKSKSNNMILKNSETQKQKKLTQIIKQQKKNKQIKHCLKISASKRLLRKNEEKTSQSCLSRQHSKQKLPKINKTVRDLSKIQTTYDKESILQNLIKNKLKLRA